MRIRNFLSGLSTIAIIVSVAVPAYSQSKEPKDATEATRAANNALLSELPFGDTSDFEDAKRGLIAPLPPELIEGESGNAIWNPKQYRVRSSGYGQSQPVAAVPTHQHERPVRGH